MFRVTLPHAVGHDLVELEAKLGGAAGDGVEELRVEKRLAAGEAGTRMPSR
jgi:hypothetical protein